MATKPTPGGSDGTYGTELNAFLDESLASDGKVKDGAVFSTSAAPTVDAGVSNKKYGDDLIVTHTAINIHIRGWCEASGISSPVVASQNNVTGVTRDSTGVYTITWDTNFASSDYAVTATSLTSIRFAVVTAIAAGSVTITFYDVSGVVQNVNAFQIMAIGNQ